MFAETDIKKKRDFCCIFVIIIFICSVILRAYLSLYEKRLSTYYDELRYMQIAKSIWHDQNFNIYGTAGDFSKILYSVFLAPFFAVSNSIRRIKLISVWNSILISSSVFPAWLTAKNITKDKFIITCAVILTALSSDMCYSMVFMSENLYLPMGLWLIYFMIKVFTAEDAKKKTVLAFLAGMYTYFLYLCKEIALAFVLAFLMIEAVRFIASKDKKILVPCGAFAAGFAVLFIIAKFTIFSDTGSSYNQTSLSQIGTPYKFAYWIYTILYDGAYLAVAFLFFPLLYPLLKINRRNTAEIRNKVYIFTALSTLITLGIITFTISVREDLGRIDMRQHLRYYCPLFLPLLVVFLDILKNESEQRNSADENKIFDYCRKIFVFMIPVVTVFILHSLFKGSAVDNTSLKFLLELVTDVFSDTVETANKSIAKSGSIIYMNAGMIIFKTVYILFIVSVFVLIKFRRNKTALLLFLIVTVSVQILNNYSTIKAFRNVTAISVTAQDEAYRLDNYLKTADGNILLVQEKKFDTRIRITDAYLSVDYCSTTADGFYNAFGGSDTINLRETKFPAIHSNNAGYYEEYDSFSYIISDSILNISEESAELIRPEGINAYYIYRLNDIYSISLTE